MALISLNIWTGSPLLALLVGARVQIARGTHQLDTLSVFVVVIVFATVSFSLIRVLAYLDFICEASAGRPRSVRRHVPWLRSMRGERPIYGSERPYVTVLDRVLITMAVAAFIAFEIWFFFFAGPPFPTWSPNSQ